MDELRARRDKGLCYYYDEKYNPHHKCKSSCFLLVGHEEIEELLLNKETYGVNTTVEGGDHVASM